MKLFKKHYLIDYQDGIFVFDNYKFYNTYTGRSPNIIFQEYYFLHPKDKKFEKGEKPYSLQMYHCLNFRFVCRL